MVEYEIAVTLRVEEYFYTEKNAVSSVSGRYSSFADAFPAYCEAVTFGYTVNEDKLNAHLAKYNKRASQVDCTGRLMLIRHEEYSDPVILENKRSDLNYDSDEGFVACADLKEEEIEVMRSHGIELEEDSFGPYISLYPVSSLLYDLSEAVDGRLDPLRDDLKLLVKEYTHAHGLLTNEIEPSEDGYFCPGSQSEEDCFRDWGSDYGFLEDEKAVFTGSLVKYEHGYVVEFRD